MIRMFRNEVNFLHTINIYNLIKKRGRKMGTIKVKGYSERKVLADVTNYQLTFKAIDLKPSYVITTIKDQCEIFLKELAGLGLDIKDVHLSEDEINTYKYEKREAFGERQIQFRTPLSPVINDKVYQIIKDNNLNVDVETEYEYSNKIELHKELIKEAVLNSKNKAELIAEANEQKIKYIDSVDYGDDYLYVQENLDDSIEFECDDDSYFEKISGKEIVESEEIYIKWFIE